MLKLKLRQMTGALTCSVLAAAAIAPVLGQTQQPQIIEQVLVKVNGDIITKTELEERQIAALRQRNLNPEILKNDEQLKKAIADVTPQLLVAAIDELLLTQLGREKGYKLSDEQFNRWLTDMRKEQGLEDEKRFQDALKQEGMTISDVRRNVERNFVMNQVQREEFGGKLQITEEEARQYYQVHQKEFTDPASVTLREILIEVPTVNQQGKPMISVGRDDEAAKKAADVRARLAAGEDFAKVATEVSSGPSKANGGLIGPIAVSELSQDLQKLLADMKPGDLTQPIRTGRGYQLLKLETSKSSGLRPYESVRDIVADRVYNERAAAEMRKFLDRVRRQAIIVWKNEELRKLYEQQVAPKGTNNPG
jgi:peptidyl-prolyl cis-trans isomerase SurA